MKQRTIEYYVYPPNRIMDWSVWPPLPQPVRKRTFKLAKRQARAWGNGSVIERIFLRGKRKRERTRFVLNERAIADGIKVIG